MNGLTGGKCSIMLQLIQFFTVFFRIPMMEKKRGLRLHIQEKKVARQKRQEGIRQLIFL